MKCIPKNFQLPENKTWTVKKFKWKQTITRHCKQDMPCLWSR